MSSIQNVLYYYHDDTILLYDSFNIHRILVCILMIITI